MVAIVDRFGRPISREILTEPQTSRLTSLRNEFGTHPSRGLTPGKLAGILQEAEHGHLIRQADLYEDMEEKDAHIFAEMDKRKRALMGLSWDIVPPPNASAKEEKAADLVKELIKDVPDIEDVLFDQGDAIGKGYACLELEWQRLGKNWLPAAITHRPPGWFTVDIEDRNTLLLRDLSVNGVPLQPFGWITHIHKAKSGYVTRSALFRVLAWPYLFKNYSIRDLAEFLEIYGLPLRLGTYPRGAKDDEKATLLQAVIGIGHDAAGIIPEGMMIDFKEAATGTNDPFESMIAWAERSQSKAILGATLTSQTDAGSGAFALGNVHMEVLRDLVTSDARQAGATLTRDLVYPLCALNLTGVDDLRRCPRFEFQTEEPEDLKLYADALPELVKSGMRIPISWAHKKLQIPEADDEEPVLEFADGAPASGGDAITATSTAAARHESGHTTDAADVLTDRLESDSASITDMLIEPIRELVMQAQTLEEIRDGLLDLLPELDESELGALMQRALASADLAGRFEIENREIITR